MNKHKALLFKLSVIIVALSLIAGFFSVPVGAIQKTIKVGYIDYEGFIEQRRSGIYTGYGIDYLDEISKHTGWNYEFVFDSWENCLKKLESGKIDLLCHAQSTPKRRKQFLFSKYSLGAETNVLYVSKDKKDIYFNDFDKFDKMKIAMMAGSYQNSAFAEFAKQNGFSYTPVYFNNSDLSFSALKRGTVDAVAMGSLALNKSYKVVAKFGLDPFYAIMTNKNFALMNELNNALSDILSSSPTFNDTLYEKYYQSNGADSSVNLTREEAEFIKSCGTISVGQIRNRRPYSALDEKTGKLFGINEDVLALISKYSGLKFRESALAINEKSLNALRKNKFDMIMGVMDNFEYRNNSLISVTDSFIETSIAVVAKNGDGFDPAKSYRVAIKSSFAAIQGYITENYKDFKISYYETDEDCMRAVKNGEADILLQNVNVVNYLLQKPEFSELEVVPTSFINEENCFIIRSDKNPLLCSVMNKTIKALPKSEIDRIIISHTSAKPYELSASDVFYKYRSQIISIAFAFVLCILMLVMILIYRQNNLYKISGKNAQLAEAVGQAERANKAKTRFLSRMSHEIRTPMNAIVGIAEIAKNHTDEPQKISEYLDKINASTKIMLNIINDVLDLSAIENEQIVITKSEFKIRSVLEQISSVYFAQCKQKGIKLEIEPDISDETLFGDGIRVNQILLNLISNAYKFTETGGKITVRAHEIRRDDKIVTVSFIISDTGVGMDKEYADSLFVTNSQKEAGFSKKYGTSGLGLAITRNLVALMNGEMSAKSELNKGSEITVILPFESIAVNSKEKALPEGYDFTKRRVLIAEDNELSAEIAAEIIRTTGADADIAKNGKEAVEMFTSSSEEYYDAILMDIQMPIINGHEAVSQIRSSSHPAAKYIPIFAMTADAFETDINAALASGMDGHISKPLDKNALFSTLYKAFINKNYEK